MSTERVSLYDLQRPLVVSLSNHERSAEWPFDKLKTSGECQQSG